MRIINIHDAKTRFSQLVDAANHGEEIIIAKAGNPVARLCPLATKKPKRKPGSFKGKIWIADDFDAPLPDDILDDFEGK
jgi:prevent-host-death family protein